MKGTTLDNWQRLLRPCYASIMVMNTYTRQCFQLTSPQIS